MPTLKAETGYYKIVSMDAVLVAQKPLPEDHPFYQLIGRVVAEWAQLEHILDLIIWDLTKGETVANSCITNQIMSAFPRFKAILALAEHRGHSETALAKIRSLRGKMQEISDERNRYVHDAWFIQTSGQDMSEVGQFKSYSEKNKSFGFSPITEAEIIRCIDKIKSASKKASALRSTLG